MHLFPKFLCAPRGPQNYLMLSRNLSNKCRYFSVQCLKCLASAAQQKSVLIACSRGPVSHVVRNGVKHEDIEACKLEQRLRIVLYKGNWAWMQNSLCCLLGVISGLDWHKTMLWCCYSGYYQVFFEIARLLQSMENDWKLMKKWV